MSRVKKHKHVMHELFKDGFELPKENQTVVKIVRSCGNNLHEIETPDSKCFLVSMPTKFRKNIWVKRGDFVLVEPIEEGNKVKGEIVKILTQEHIREYTKNDIWPKAFTKKRDISTVLSEDSDLVPNMNRKDDPGIAESETSDSDDE